MYNIINWEKNIAWIVLKNFKICKKISNIGLLFIQNMWDILNEKFGWDKIVLMEFQLENYFLNNSEEYNTWCLYLRIKQINIAQKPYSGNVIFLK